MMELRTTTTRLTRSFIFAGLATLSLAACGENGQAEQTGQVASTSADANNITSTNEYMKSQDGGYSIGNADAPVVVIEYASYTCLHCADFHSNVLPKLKEKYIDTGKVRYEMRPFLRNEVDFYATLVVDCSATDRFEPLSSLFFSTHWSQSDDYKAVVGDIAKKAGFASARYEQCVTDETRRKEILGVTQIGIQKYKIQATPTIVVDGDVIEYRQGWVDLDRAIQNAL